MFNNKKIFLLNKICRDEGGADEDQEAARKKSVLYAMTRKRAASLTFLEDTAAVK